MSRQRNVGKDVTVIEEGGASDFEKTESYHESLDKGSSDLLASIFGGSGDLSDITSKSTSLILLTLRTIYSVLPFIIIAYFWDIYTTPTESLYYPDFPNALTSTTSELNDMNVEFYDLADYKSTSNGWQRNERILFLVPLRDAAAHLPMFFGHMRNMTYPHNLIDMSFLVSDTSDSTVDDLKFYISEFQNDPDKTQRFGRIEIYEKDFGQIVGQSFSDRHGFAAQGPRRKLMAIARNWLLTTALRPDHSWVYWRDIDVETSPATILEDLIHHDRDVIVPNIWRPLPDWLGYEQAYDLNSWQESEGGIELAERLDEDAVIVEGYPEYATWRPHLAYLRDPYGDPEVEMELDGIGGVSIMAKAHVFRRGAMFPAFSFKKHAETEAFGKLCKTMGFEVIGLPHYVIWHIYEPSTDDLKHMEWLANEELRQKELLKNKEFYDRAWEIAFEDVNEKWQAEKFNVFKNNDLSSLKIGQAHWDEVDEYLTEVDDIEMEEDQVDENDDSFMWHFNDKQNKRFEQAVIEKLKHGPKKFGQNKHEFIFGDYNSIAGGYGQKKKKFKKFEKPVVNKGEEGEESSLEGTYDLNSDRVVDQNKFANSEVSENDLAKDKELFNDMEMGKAEADVEEEGEVELKAQKPIEEVKKETKEKKAAAAAAKSTKATAKAKKATVRTLYEIDEEGYTVATVRHTVKPKPTKAAVVEQVDEEEEEVEEVAVKKPAKKKVRVEAVQEDEKIKGNNDDVELLEEEFDLEE
ncbi:CYFA0S10e02234g1_1 [Cyberlindnera fabianii]|uniref:CYFA0S10e02234g1_1 n=1 Tax=Cyberlindnera fabianii TaxID=36022 RepID=A0A061B528_CYBFA|nr:CYFA0S10e02234g1_1 [Cyberlindnera fabianii]